MGKKLIIFCALVTGIIFLPTTTLLVFGMLPTLAAFTIDRTVGKSKTVCIGFMNFAGCFPFLLDFWTKFGQQSMENALAMIADIQNVMIIYLLAAGGYAVDIAVTGITSSLIIQSSTARLKRVKTKQKGLEEHWGQKVTGKYKLDEYGFPVETIEHRTKL